MSAENSILRTGQESPLDLIDRTSEILFGLIMVLTFTGSMSAADVGRDDIREMFIGAVGCNLAWGIIDSLMFLLSTLTTRGRNYQLWKTLRASSGPAHSRTIIAEALPGNLGSILEPKQLDEIGVRLLAVKEDDLKYRVRWSDLRAAFVVFGLVFLSTFPVVVPFLFLHDPYVALRISNLIAVIMLFAMGYTLGRYAGRRPVLWGVIMAVAGAALVSITIALGG